ncbi:MAG: SCO family protein [Burkholderiales bacterium]
MTQSSQIPNAGERQRSNFMLWLVLAVCLAPFIAATVLHRYFPPDSRMNFGELVEPVPLPNNDLQSLDGKTMQISALRGKWIMVHVDSGVCDAACNDKLWKIRQLRLTQGKNMERIERLWLVADQTPIDATLQKEYAGTHIWRAGNEFIRLLPATNGPHQHIWLIDPLGNVMMRYSRDADPSRIKNDLIRLLKVSQIG